MRKIVFSVTLCAGVVSAGAAFAERWVVPVNGTVSSVMMTDGDVMMKVQIPAKEFAAITGMMEAKKNACTLFQTSQGTLQNSVLLACGANREYLPATELAVHRPSETRF